MRPFTYTTAQSAKDAVDLGTVQADAHVRAPVQFLAGGTTLIDLMKLDVMRPSTLVSTSIALQDAGFKTHRGERSGASARSARSHGGRCGSRGHQARLSGHCAVALAGGEPAAAQHGDARRQRPAAHALHLFSRRPTSNATSAIRARAARRSTASTAACGARHVSEHCIATYPGDFAQAPDRARRHGRDCWAERLAHRPVHRMLHRNPAIRRTSRRRWRLGELISAFIVPSGALDAALALSQGARPGVLRVRARFGGGRARSRRRSRARRRVALGGVATMPWRAREAEALLRGEPLDGTTWPARAAEAAFAARQAASTTHSRSRSASERWSARSARPPRWRFDMSDCRSRAESQYGPARAAHRRRGSR